MDPKQSPVDRAFWAVLRVVGKLTLALVVVFFVLFAAMCGHGVGLW